MSVPPPAPATIPPRASAWPAIGALVLAALGAVLLIVAYVAGLGGLFWVGAVLAVLAVVAAVVILVQGSHRVIAVLAGLLAVCTLVAVAGFWLSDLGLDF